MRYGMKFKKVRNRRGGLSLAILVVLSIACEGANSHDSAASQPDSATPAAASSQPVATNRFVDPSEAKFSTKPSIQITEVPSKGAGPDRVETIAGTAGGVNIAECKVVVFAYTNTWYVQPYIGSSDIAIKENGTWQTDTHLGSQYAALLTKNSYKPPETTGKLPDVGREVLAIVIVSAK